MNENVKAANRLKIEKIIQNLKKRNMEGYACETKEDALQTLLSLIPEGSQVAWGGTVTLGEIGADKVLKAGDYDVIDPKDYIDPAEGFEARRRALLSDVFLTSANAVTMDGELVNIDGRGNRVAATIFGPNKVIFIVGANKIVRHERDAIDRIKSDACPPNCIRLGRQTPCALTGKCGECLMPGQTVCCHTVTTRFNLIDDRIHVILVNETLGY